LQVVDITSKTNVATYIVDTICEMIEKVRSENVVQVVIDNVAVCKSAG
jgi:ribosomal protein S7